MPNALGLVGQYVAGGLLIFLGGVFILCTLHTVWMGFRSTSWPIAFGRVVTSQRKKDDGDEETEVVPQEAPLISPKLQPSEFAYEYEVDGKRFTACTIQFRGSARPNVADRIEQELRSSYRVGESVTVYYNPAMPEEAALKAGIPPGLFPGVVVGAVLILIGLLFCGVVPPDR